MKRIVRNLVFVALIAFMLTGCGKIPKLKDGSELVFDMGDMKMTTEEFYQKLKDTYGTSMLINSIDELVLNEVYETTDTMKTQIESQITSMKNQWGSDFSQAIQYYYGVTTEAQLYDLIESSLKRELTAKDYAKTLITDKDIEKYYNEKAIGDMKISHILIKSDAASDATDEDKKEAEEKALEKAKEIIKKLSKGEKFADLAKENSADSSASDGGDLGYINRGETVSQFEEAAVALKVDEYTKEPVKTQYGYHIILKTDQKTKPKLEEIKEDITKTLIEQYVANTENISAYSMEWLRNEHGLKIYDAELKIKYDHTLNEQKTAKNNTTTE